jgi:MGT family glycosyltransferase
MARFLFTVWPFPGHFFPSVAIAHALRVRGHEPAFYTGAEACRTIGDEGFYCFPFVHVDEQRLDFVLFSPAYRTRIPVKRLLDLKRMHREWLLETIPHQVQDIEAIMAQWQPDVIVTDPTMLGPILILHEKHAIPVAIASFIPACTIPGSDAPPFGPGLPRPHNRRSRLLAWLFQTVSARMTAEFRDAANSLRQRYDLPLLQISVADHAGRMPLYLVPSAPEFDYQRMDLPRSVHYIGPCIWNTPRVDEMADWLVEIPSDQPWIHVSEGTLHTGAPFMLRAAARGLAQLPVQVIMTTGGSRDPKDLNLGHLASNIHVTRWVSHSELLPHTDVVVTTGGAGSVLASLSAGVPLVIVPTEWDKPENAQRVVEAGAGLRLAPRACTPARLRAAVEQILADPSFRQNAQRLAAIFARYDGAPHAAELLEELSIREPARETVAL